MKRVRVLTHNDLDGLAANAILHWAHPADHVHASVHTYQDINEALKSALEEKVRPFDRIVVADISWKAPDPSRSPSEAEYRLVEHELPEAVRAFSERGGELVLLDHHPAALATRAYYQRFLHQDSIVETKDALGVPRAGSELASRYYKALREFQSDPIQVEAVMDFGRVCGVYDCWRQADPDWELGCRWALAQSELLNDSQTCLREMQGLIQKGIQYFRTRRLDGWGSLTEGTVFGNYVSRAQVRFEDVVTEARRTAIGHGPFVTEIHTDFFESLVAERIYQETGGVVCVRYEKERHLAKKLSFRRHKDMPVDLGKVLSELSETAGGHPASAGIRLGSLTIDHVIDHVTAACEQVFQPGAA